MEESSTAKNQAQVGARWPAFKIQFFLDSFFKGDKNADL